MDQYLRLTHIMSCTHTWDVGWLTDSKRKESYNSLPPSLAPSRQMSSAGLEVEVKMQRDPKDAKGPKRMKSNLYL